MLMARHTCIYGDVTQVQRTHNHIMTELEKAGKLCGGVEDKQCLSLIIAKPAFEPRASS